MPATTALPLLFAYYDRYRELVEKGCPFALRDVVTPRANGTLRGHGEPHIVVEVRDCAEPVWVGAEQGEIGFGRRLDMRVVSAKVHPDANNGALTFVMYWVESTEFEKWQDATATTK